MSANIELVKKVVAACEAKDFSTLRPLIAADYTLKDPTMTLNGADELIAMIENCPFDGKMQHCEYLDAGSDKVVMTGECVTTKPASFSFRFCDILTLRNGKLVQEEMFYDTANFPDEVKNMGQQAQQRAGAKKKAA